MSVFKELKIGIFGLKNGTHEFDFSFNDDLFAEFEYTQLSKGKGSCKVEMEKSDSMITLHFKVSGEIALECDRSLEMFDHPIEIEKSLIFKFGDEEKELSDDVFVIQKTTQEINIASFLFEIIHLEIPMKKIHPNFQDGSDFDEMVFSSGQEEEKKEEKVDPRWEALKKLK